MNRADFSAVSWLPPWEPTGSGLESELEREVGSTHPLHGAKATSIGRRVDNDDVLFLLLDKSPPLAVVHLTWTMTREQNPDYPWTTFYNSLEDWVETCMKPDHKLY